MTGKHAETSLKKRSFFKNKLKGIDKEKLIHRYLFTYNFLQTIGWTYLLFQVIQYYITKPDVPLFTYIQWTLVIFQNAAVLEAINSIFKLISSNPSIVVPQIYSRVSLVCLILLPMQDPRTSMGLPMLLLAWSFTEIVRYATYTLSLVNTQLYILKWLRYSMFIVLYPLGVTGEMLCMFAGIKEVQRTNLWCWEMPNMFNVIFHYDYYIIFTILLYIPVFPMLYLHMFGLRKKVIGPLIKKKAN